MIGPIGIKLVKHHTFNHVVTIILREHFFGAGAINYGKKNYIHIVRIFKDSNELLCFSGFSRYHRNL